MTYTALIVDDEPLARQYLGRILGRISGVKVVGEAEGGEEALAMIEDVQPDLVFLDVQMPGMTGLELAHLINQMEKPPYLVFTTGYEEYAVQAFEQAALDYITKPYEQERVEKTLARMRQLAAGEPEAAQERAVAAVARTWPELTRLPIRVESTIKLIDPKDILFVQARGKKVILLAREGEIPVPYTVTKLEEWLSGKSFFRANEGCLVNMDYVQEIIYVGDRTYELILKDKAQTIIPLSRTRSRVLREMLKRFGQ